MSFSALILLQLETFQDDELPLCHSRGKFSGVVLLLRLVCFLPTTISDPSSLPLVL